jgi:hypothetical protein
MSKQSLSSLWCWKTACPSITRDLSSISGFTLTIRLPLIQDMYGYVFRYVRKERRPVVRLPFIGKRYSAATRDDTSRCNTC